MVRQVLSRPSAKVAFVVTLGALGFVISWSLLASDTGRQKSQYTPPRPPLVRSEEQPSADELAKLDGIIESYDQVMAAGAEPPATLDSANSVAPSAQDVEWERFPRRRIGFPNALVAGSSIAVEALFRSHELNPRDTYIPPSVRESLHKLAEARLRLLRETTDAKLEVGNTEFSVAVENQTARGVSKADAMERMRLSGVAPTPPRLPGGPKPAAEDVYYFTPTAIWGYTPTFIAPRTDKLWFADASELPGAHLYLQLQQFMAEEVALLVLGWFSAAGTLTLPEVHKLTDAVRHSVEQLR